MIAATLTAMVPLALSKLSSLLLHLIGVSRASGTYSASCSEQRVFPHHGVFHPGTDPARGMVDDGWVRNSDHWRPTEI